jgi:diguanylate cyclase (GGDEF)-like protein/PAS domain S-box-containing protein
VALRQNVQSDPVVASAEQNAAAALRELPEALILVFDEELRFVLAVGQALARRGDPPAYRPRQFLKDAFPMDLWRQIEPLCRSALAGETRTREIWTTGRDHCLMIDVGPLSAQGSAEKAAGAGAAAGGVATVLDISARRQMDAFSARSADDFEGAFERAPIATGLLDCDGRWVLASRALSQITGYTVDELIGRRFGEIVHPDDADNDASECRRMLAGEISAFQVEKRYYGAAGEVNSAIFSVALVRDREGSPLYYIAQLQDVSERERLERELLHLADHDPLTGLRNRRLFEHDLRLQVARSRRYGEEAALMVIDLDDFKQVNRRHGQGVGDETLKAVARALTRRLRETDLVARLGGDEFAVLLPHIDGKGLRTVVTSLSRAVPEWSIEAGDAVLHCSASVGFAIIDRQTASAEQVLAEADRSMYAAKRTRAAALRPGGTGRGRFS